MLNGLDKRQIDRLLELVEDKIHHYMRSYPKDPRGDVTTEEHLINDQLVLLRGIKKVLRGLYETI